MVTGAGQPVSEGRRERFVKNVLWSWAGVIVSLITGIWLSPYVIHKLGNEGYGVWALVFSFLEYYWLLDLGFRSATVKYTAHYRATGEVERVNEVINTGLAYSGVMAVVLAVATLLWAKDAHSFFQISAGYTDLFGTLVLMVGSAWAGGMMFSLLSGAVEAYQRFDLTSRVWILTTALRTAGLVVVLALGYRLRAMAGVAIACLLVGYACNYYNLRRAFPQLRFSVKRVKASMMKRMFHYGASTSVATLSDLVLNQAAPLVIGHFLPTAFVGYYALAVRLLRYTVDLVGKVGFVTSSSAAEMAARGDYGSAYRMGVYVNRYCYALFAPFAMAVSLYGGELLKIWINPEFARMTAPILPVIALSTTWATAAQYNASSILYGLAKHRGYAWALLTEAILGAAALWYTVPRYGLEGAAWSAAILMVGNRALFTSWLFCRGVSQKLLPYLRSVYVRPTLTALPLLVAALWVKARVLPGRNWFEVIAGMGWIIAAYYAIAYFSCLEKEHQALPWRWVRERLGSRAA